MQRDTLFLLAAPFEDEDALWFCRHCAQLEGALLANPHWWELIDVHRVAFPRPRAAVIALVGEENQDLPKLVLPEGAPLPGNAKTHNGRGFLEDPEQIAAYLAEIYGGAGPHP